MLGQLRSYTLLTLVNTTVSAVARLDAKGGSPWYSIAAFASFSKLGVVGRDWNVAGFTEV